MASAGVNIGIYHRSQAFRQFGLKRAYAARVRPQIPFAQMRFRSDVDDCDVALACDGHSHVVFEFEKFENRGRRYGFDNPLLAIGLARLPTHRLRGFRRSLEDFVEWLI